MLRALKSAPLRYKDEVLDPRKKDTETEKLGRNVWVPSRGWILGYFVFTGYLF
jgi:hypothetical protein